MKKLILTFLIFLVFFSPNLALSETVKVGEVIKRGGLLYKKNSGVLLTGEVVDYHDNGNLWSKEMFKNGKQEGPATYFWKNGQLEHIFFFKNGKREGPTLSYWDDGRVMQKLNYRNGKPHGMWESYYSGGKLAYKGEYVNGRKQGSWESYNIDGSVNENTTGEYRNGKMINTLSDSWKGNYICTVDDKSEIYDSEYDNGHHYFDLDGDTSDPKINIPVSITEQKVLIGQIFSGKPIAPLHFKRIDEFKKSKSRPSILGVCIDKNCYRTTTVIFTKENKTGKFGFSQFQSSYSTPSLGARQGEAYVMSELMMGHCIKQ